jgi:hypothetical protein
VHKGDDKDLMVVGALVRAGKKKRGLRDGHGCSPHDKASVKAQRVLQSGRNASGREAEEHFSL